MSATTPDDVEDNSEMVYSNDYGLTAEVGGNYVFITEGPDGPTVGVKPETLYAIARAVREHNG